MTDASTPFESVFTVEATPIKFGPGAAAEAGWELARLGVRRAFVVVDPALLEQASGQAVLENLRQSGAELVIFSDIRVEPDRQSLERAAAAARESGADGFVALGGGSTIDTAKVANLLASCGGGVMDYVNPPIGAGRTGADAAAGDSDHGGQRVGGHHRRHSGFARIGREIGHQS
jgi:hydroxyacid-oxoacid transhydrogenase